MAINEKQVKSRERVANHGEVFTAEREVKAMCDLVKRETERIESRFLEPACGNGNFLAEVLQRKLTTVKNRYGKSLAEYERYAVLAVSSLYGVEILSDNVHECRERLFTLWNENYTAIVNDRGNESCRNAVRFILKKNILCGDALTLLQDNGTPIVFAEWSLVSETKMKRRDFVLSEILNGHEEQTAFLGFETLCDQPDFFPGLGRNTHLSWSVDPETHALIPDPVWETPLVHYWEVQDHDR